jgi:nucleoside-diphosphate-sugar epimerase
MSRCLVTGHRGYIGSKLKKELESQGHEVMGIDFAENSKNDINIKLAEDTDGKFDPHYFNFRPEYVFHLACIPRVAYSVEQPVETCKNNILAGSNVLNFAKKVGSVKRFIYSSSSSVVGNGSGPESPYALQKYTTELETTMYSKLYGLDTVSLRYFNVYSHDQEASGPYATAVANWMSSIRRNANPYITGDGEQRRDMLNVKDAISANVFCMNQERDFSGSVFDVGTGHNISLNEIKELIKNELPSIKFEYRPARAGDVILTKANTEPLKLLGWKTEIKITEGLKQCFLRSNLCVESLAQ